ncbi:MAG: UvrD-helicase domain-containing protein [Nitrospira sp.]
MNKLLAQRVISSFGLTPDQKEAALERDRDVVVTAGAGSGKTRTLVARYASLLADGFRPRRVTAITFTEKAAREMRSRVRDTLIELTQNAESDDEQQMWQTLSTQMDSARISTIHSLCAEILRTHPAEGGVDPRFEILEEGIASALRAQVVDDTLSRFVENPIFTPLFEILTISSLKNLLKFLIEHRLEAREAFEQKFESTTIILQGIENALQHPEISNAITDLRSTPLSVLENDGRAAMVNDLLALWKISEDALASGNMMDCAIALHQARREKMKSCRRKKEPNKGYDQSSTRDL